jgi:protein involved in polysaccharide export with SLBB domain
MRLSKMQLWTSGGQLCWQRLKPLCLLVMALLVGLMASSLVRAEEAYRLDAGDKLRVNVYNEPSLSGEFEVDGSGFVSLPLIGEVAARDLTVRELEQRVADALRGDYLVSPRVSVEVTNYRPFYIIGEVNNPGRYAYVDGMTVMNAVAMAGGFTYRARESRAEIKRQGQGEVDRNAAPHSPVMPGDVITIPERFF